MVAYKTHVDFYNGADTGADNANAIQPIQTGEPGVPSTFRRPTEHLRARTDVLREEMHVAQYHRDKGHLALSGATGHSLTWGGTVASGGSGQVIQVGDLLLRPFLSPAANTKGSLSIGVAGVNEITYSISTAKYAFEGYDKVYVEHIDGGTGTPLNAEVTPSPIMNISVTFDSTNVLHTPGGVSSAVAGALTIAGVSPTDIVCTVNGTGIVSTQARTLLPGVADAEEHKIPAGALDTLTTANPLVEGDTVAAWYAEATGSVASRAGSNAALANTNVSLFITSLEPEKIPGAIPVCKVVNNDLVFLDSTRLVKGATGPVGSRAHLTIDGTPFTGATTSIANGGIATSVTTAQTALESVDARLTQLRAVTYTVTDGSASTGGDFNGLTAIRQAIDASPAGSTIFVRRGVYVALTIADTDNNVKIVGEGPGLVTIDGVTVNSGATLGLYDVTLSYNLYSYGTNCVFDNIVVNATVTCDGLTAKNSSYRNITAYIFSCTGENIEVTNCVATRQATLQGTSCTYTNITVGPTVVIATSNASLVIGGTSNFYTQITVEPRAIALAVGVPVIDLGGTNNSVVGLYTNQTSSVLVSGDLVTELNAFNNSTMSNAHVTTQVGVPLILGTGAAASTVTNSTFSNTSTNAADYVFRAAASSSTLTFRNCVFDNNEQDGKLTVSIDANSTAVIPAKYCFYACDIYAHNTSASAIYLSEFYAVGCTFHLKPPVNGGLGVRLRGGTETGLVDSSILLSGTGSTLAPYASTLKDCTIDFWDSEVINETGSGNPLMSTSPVVMGNVTADGLTLARLNKHIHIANNGLLNIAGSSTVRRFNVAFTSTVAAQTGTPQLDCFISITANNCTIQDIRHSHETGVGVNTPTPAIAAIVTRSSVTNLTVENVHLVGATYQLVKPHLLTNTITSSRVTRCIVGSDTNPVATPIEALPGDDNIMSGNIFYMGGVGSLLWTQNSTFNRMLLANNIFNHIAITADSTPAIDGNTTTINELHLVGNSFYLLTSASGIRVLVGAGLTLTNPVGAGNIHLNAPTGTTTAPSITTNVW